MVHQSDLKRLNYLVLSLSWLKVFKKQIKTLTVVKNRAVLATATDAGVCHEASTTVVTAEKLEERLQLVLHHARSNALHHLHVRIRAHLAHIAQHFQFMVRLEDAQFADLAVQNVSIDGEPADTVKSGLFRVDTRIRVQTEQRQQNIGFEFLQNFLDLLSKEF